MARSGKNFIKPGSLAQQKKSRYELVRDMRIKKNNAIMKALGIKGIIPSLKDSHHPKCSNEKGKDLQNDEVFEMAPGRRAQFSVESQRPLIFAPEMVTHSPPRPEPSDRRGRLNLEPRHDLTFAPNMVIQPSSSPGEATMCTNVAHNRRTRGITRGLLVQKKVDKDGKLFFPIPQEFRAPIGINASKLASKIGIEIRSTVQDLTVKHWKAIDEGTKAPMVQRIKDQFDLSGDPIDVIKVLGTKCGQRLSEYTYRLHKKFKKLEETKGEVYARSYPPIGVNVEQWMDLIDKKLTNPNWKDRSMKNTANRAKLKTKQRCGSKSIPVRVHEHITSHNGKLPNLPEFYKSTHHNASTDEWIAPECQRNYEKMVQIELEHSQAGKDPPTHEHLSVEVLLPRSGYVKGLGLRPSSTIRTTSGSSRTNEYVACLEKKIEAQNDKIAELLESNKEQKSITTKMMEFLMEKGYIEAFGSADISPTE